MFHPPDPAEAAIARVASKYVYRAKDIRAGIEKLLICLRAQSEAIDFPQRIPVRNTIGHRGVGSCADQGKSAIVSVTAEADNAVLVIAGVDGVALDITGDVNKAIVAGDDYILGIGQARNTFDGIKLGLEGLLRCKSTGYDIPCEHVQLAGQRGQVGALPFGTYPQGFCQASQIVAIAVQYNLFNKAP